MFIILLGPAFIFLSLTWTLVAEQASPLLTVAKGTETWLLEASGVEEIDSSHWWLRVITLSQFTQFTISGGGRGALQLVLATSPITVSRGEILPEAASVSISVFSGITETAAAVEAGGTAAVLAEGMGEYCSVAAAAACLCAALKAAVRSLLRSWSAGPR